MRALLPVLLVALLVACGKSQAPDHEEIASQLTVVSSVAAEAELLLQRRAQLPATFANLHAQYLSKELEEAGEKLAASQDAAAKRGHLQAQRLQTILSQIARGAHGDELEPQVTDIKRHLSAAWASQ